MKIELTEAEAHALLAENLQKLIPIDLTRYDMEFESVSRYSSSNPGGLEITLTRKAEAA